MNLSASRAPYGARLATLLGTASLLTLASVATNNGRAEAQQVAQVGEEIPENVLITGSLIRGTVAVGVPVVNLSPMDFAQTGALTTADLFKNFPAANFMSGDIGSVAAARIDRGQKINLRNLDTTNSVRGLLMIDGLRFPAQGNGLCAIDPSVIPSVSLDHIDVLVDGASATYGSDAISGVVNIILRRNYDGAQTQFRYTYRKGGGPRYQASQLWGRTWDGGQITLSYEWYNELPVKGNFWSGFSVNHSPWGYDDRTPIGSANPGIISKAPFPATAPFSSTINQTLGTSCGYFNVPGNQSNIASAPSTCYSVPLGTGQNFRSDLNGGIGPLTPGSASTLNWTTFSQDTNFAGPLNPSAGTRNEFNPYSMAYYSPFEDRNGGAVTIDQRLTKDISFYGSGFYSNRRSKFLNSNNANPSANGAIIQVAVPTFNPYYPSGTFCVGAQPVTSSCLPTNLRISYDISRDLPAIVDGNELATRYHFGLNFALPASWEGQVFYAQTYDSNYDTAFNGPNKNAISAALGWTIAAIAPSGTAPSFGTWSKPAAVPYLNLFCDPYAYKCNSQTTLQYLVGTRANVEKWWINEKGVKADGPLFDLPGGTVKMAVGADYTANHFSYSNSDNTSGPNLTVNPTVDALHQNVWAVFTQVNIPVFGDNFNFFGARRLELEASWRHDQYDTVGGTSNPKVSFNWAPIDDLTVKGTWGSNFRAPAFAETSFIAKSVIQGRNLGAFQSSPGTAKTCAGVNNPLPSPTSGAGKLQWDAFEFNNAMAAAGAPGYTAAAGCIDRLLIPGFASPGITPTVPGLLAPGGITAQGGEPVTDIIRSFTRFGRQLKPELATTWGIGFDYAPTNFLRGLDVQATYYIVKITSALRQFGGGGFNDTLFADPTVPFVFPSPRDLIDASGNRLCPDLPNSVVPSIPIPANLVPSACGPWVQSAAAIISNPKATVQGQGATYIYWIDDAATFNAGWVKLDGIDWQLSYDWDMGNIGAFNIGAIGTYYLHQYQQAAEGADITDSYHSTVGSSNAEARGVSTTPTLIYRARLGWANGPWTVTGFMDYRGHSYSSQASPPNVNGTCVSTGSTIGGGTFPCAQNNYTNLAPPWYSFDLSVGYDTGVDPANDYLKNIGIQMIIQDLFDKHPGYAYTLTAFPCSCNGTQPAFGRQISFVVTKTW